MNEMQFKNIWDDVKGKAKEHWGKLTNDDLDQINGKKDQLLASIEKRYGYTKEKAKLKMNEFLESLKNGSKASKLQETIQNVSEKVSNAGQGIADKGERLLEKGEKFTQHAQSQAEEKYKKTAHYIKQHPFQSVLIISAVGLLIGKLFKAAK